jgi:DNA-binding CsgD family transcriptional regulator
MDTGARLAAELYNLGDRESYLRAAGELLSALFPSDLIGWVGIDCAAMSAEIVAFPEPLPDYFAGLLVETADENPFIQSYVGDRTPGMWAPRRLSDLMPDLDLRRSRTYSLGLRPLGIDRQIAVLSGRPGAASVQAWTVGRMHRDFTDTETGLLHRVQPMLRLLEKAYGGTGGLPDTDRCAAAYSLTDREVEILSLLAKGLTGAAVGHLLGISPRTVGKHLEHAYAKLGCTNRIDALRLLRRP